MNEPKEVTAAAATATPAATVPVTSETVDKKKYDEIAGRLGSTLEQLEKIKADAKASEEAKLAEQGQYKELLEKTKAELEQLKPRVSEADQLRSAFDVMLKAEAAGIEDVADAIISNVSLTYEERLTKVRALKEKLSVKGGTGTSAGSAGKATVKTEITPADFNKMTLTERAKFLRESQGK